MSITHVNMIIVIIRITINVIKVMMTSAKKCVFLLFCEFDISKVLVEI